MLQIHPGHPGALKVTARQLVLDRFGNRPFGRAAISDAIADLGSNGWLANYTPGPFEFERFIIFVPTDHRFAAVFRCLDATGTGVVPRGLIESRTRCRLSEPMARVWLTTYGLALMRVDGCNVHLRGTSSGMAGRVNRLRFEDDPTLVDCDLLVENATGLLLPLNRLNEDLRLRAAQAFGSFGVEAPGLLTGQTKSTLRSQWRFPSEYNKDDIPF
jgi:hypothetical protein